MYDIIPHAPDAERSVLADMMIDKHIAKYALDMLDVDCFYTVSHQLIFTAISKAMRAGYTADMITVCEFLRRDEAMDQVGGEAYISELVNDISTSNSIFHVKILLEKAVLRGCSDTFHRGIEFSHMPDATPDKVLATAEKRIMGFRRRMERIGGEVVYDHESSTEAYLNRLSTPDSADYEPLKWPVERMNEITLGAAHGKTYLFAGYEKGGKSRFVRCCVSNWIREGHAGVIIQTEEDPNAVHKCIIAHRCRINTLALQSRQLTDIQRAQIAEEVAIYRTEPIHIAKKPAASPAYVREILEREKTRYLKIGKRLEWCVIDTVQRMKKHADDSNTMHEEIAAELSDIAIELNIVLVEIMQFVAGAERGTQTKSSLQSQVRYGKAYREAAEAIIVFDDRRKSKKDIEKARSRGYRIIRTHIVQREGESHGYVDLRAELQYSSYSDAAGEKPDEDIPLNEPREW